MWTSRAHCMPIPAVVEPSKTVSALRHTSASRIALDRFKCIKTDSDLTMRTDLAKLIHSNAPYRQCMTVNCRLLGYPGRTEIPCLTAFDTSVLSVKK